MTSTHQLITYKNDVIVGKSKVPRLIKG